MNDLFDRTIIDQLSDIKQRVAGLVAQDSIKLDSSTGLPYFPSLTAGSVLFAGSGGLLSQDNSNFFWNDANNTLAVPTLISSILRPGGLLDISNTGAGATTSIELGSAASGNRYCYIDFHGDDTYTDYALRIIRENAGANTASRMQHRGTGDFSFEAIDSAALTFKTASTTRLTIANTGWATFSSRVVGGEHFLAGGNFYPGNATDCYYGRWGASTPFISGNVVIGGGLYPSNQGTYYFGLSGSNTYTNTNMVSAGRFYPGNQSTWGFAYDGVGGGFVDGNFTVGAGATAVSGGAGILSLGNTVINFNPTSGNWTSGGTTLLLSGADYSTIGFHDAGNRVDFIRTGAGVMQLGYNGGWGNATIEILNNTGIGDVPATANRLRVKGASSSSSDGALIVQNSSGTTLMQNRDDNVNQVGTAWVVISDEATKDHIDVLVDGLAAVKQLRPKRYVTKAGNHKTFGLVAQDVQAIFPDMVVELDDGVLGLRYNDLIPVCINAIIELEGKVTALEDKLAKLKPTKSA